jgi:hypothetical protein
MALKMTGSREKGCFDRERLIIEVEENTRVV